MITTIGRFKRLKGEARKSGYSVVELLVAMVVAAMFLGVAASSINMLARSSMGIGNYTDMNSSSRRSLENFATDVRMAVNVVTSTNTDLRFWAYNDSYTLVQVRYWYDAAKDEVYRSYGGVVSTVLTDVKVFDFDYYDLTHSSTTNALSVKEVEINASLKKKVFSLDNTNEIISARFMMRNRQVSS